ncbi:MAG: hypothetical protein GX654_10545 [Desulfatiglans sp.]|nr:hypothetical protein [Desulfatiglans sp.]
MSKLLVTIGIFCIIYFLFKLIKKGNLKKIKSTSDEIFFNEFQRKFGISNYSIIVEERKRFSNYFNIDRRKIGVDLKLNVLVKVCELAGGYIALNDIVYDLHELGYHEKVEKIILPDTVGEIIYLFLVLRNK